MIDWKRIEDLRDEVGVDDFVEIAGLFLQEVEDVLGSLSGVHGSVSRSESFHSLKGSAMNLGFSHMAQLCAEAETHPDDADVNLIHGAFEASKQALQGWFAAI